MSDFPIARLTINLPGGGDDDCFHGTSLVDPEPTPEAWADPAFVEQLKNELVIWVRMAVEGAAARQAERAKGQ